MNQDPGKLASGVHEAMTNHMPMRRMMDIVSTDTENYWLTGL